MVRQPVFSTSPANAGKMQGSLLTALNGDGGRSTPDVRVGVSHVECGEIRFSKLDRWLLRPLTSSGWGALMNRAYAASGCVEGTAISGHTLTAGFARCLHRW
jgi:hypothetical protein